VARHRIAGGQHSSPAPPAAHGHARARPRGAHRAHTPPTALRARIVLAAAASTLTAAGAPMNTNGSAPDKNLHSLVRDADTDAAMAFGAGVPDLGQYHPQILATGSTGTGQLDRLHRGQQVATEHAAREAARAEAEQIAREAADRTAREAAAREAADRAAREAAARRPAFVAPTVGRLTSTYGTRWGSMHWGIDIANRIGTPIVSAADGVVVEAGPASGFGLWVRVRHTDGTITVYGHVDRTLARQGQAVKAGQQIATMGNRGQSTGPHLHFEVWTAGGSKINPLTWLRSKGVQI
jgi:murein DD-endopeptidase MepM/ murein hydrolase activator NlpD